MLWYKSWIETRWQFIVGAMILVCSAAGVVMFWPKVAELIPLASTVEATGSLGRKIKEGAELAREYRGYVWSQGFRQSLSNMTTLFAVLLGTAGLLSHRGSGIFLLSLPVSRLRFVATRAGTGIAELFTIAFVPSLTIVLLSPTVGKSYGIEDALVHGLCLFLASTVFFSFAFMLSAVFGDFWRPLLIALLVAILMGSVEQLAPDQWSAGIFHVMSGETYFRHGELPWFGFFAIGALSAAMLYGAAIRIERQDF